MNNLYALILAGGSGTRLWPMSRLELPKQLLNLGGDLSLLQETVSRLESRIPPERMIFVTSKEFVFFIELPKKQEADKWESKRRCEKDQQIQTVGHVYQSFSAMAASPAPGPARAMPSNRGSTLFSNVNCSVWL